MPPADALRKWSAADVKAFLRARDLTGLAEVCFASDVTGEDLASFDEQAVVTDMRLTPFQAKKLIAARSAFLAGEVGDGRSGR